MCTKGTLPLYMSKQRVQTGIVSVGPETADLLDKLLICNPKDRITAAQALEHDAAAFAVPSDLDPWLGTDLSWTLNELLARFARAGLGEAQLGVHEENVSAAPALYASLGWSVVSSHRKWIRSLPERPGA